MHIDAGPSFELVAIGYKYLGLGLSMAVMHTVILAAYDM